MKKIVTLVLAVALLAPSISFAAPFISDPDIPSFTGNPTDTQQANFDATEKLTASGEVVGCNVTGLGGALGQTFAAALQQAIPGFIRNQLQGPLNKLAAAAGPFGGVIQAIGNIALNKLSTFVQNKIGEITGNLLGGTVGQVLGGVIPGVGASEIPVKDEQTRKDLAIVKGHTDIVQQAQKLDQDRNCVGNPLVNKIKNALLSLVFKSTIDAVNNDDWIIQNIRDFLVEGADAVAEDFIENQLSGLCSTQKQTVQTVLLSQYQYETNFGRRVQCRGDEEAVAEFERGMYDPKTMYETLFNNTLAYDVYLISKSELNSQQGAQVEASRLRIGADGIYNDKIKCTVGEALPQGGYCDGNTGVVIVPSDLRKAELQAALQQSRDQLLSADEIGELIDALTASVSQVALQGIDGLLGLSKKQGAQGSYLDAMVSGTTGGAYGAAQDAVASDIGGGIAIEEAYRDTVDAVLQSLVGTKAGYTQVVACYKLKSTTGSNTALALEKMNNASTTIAVVIDPQIKALTLLKNESQDAIDQLTAINAQTQSALTAEDIINANQAYTALAQAGLIHTATDLTFLQNDLEASVDSLNLLATDASAQLLECQAL